MLPNNTQIPIIHPIYLPPQQRQPLSRMNQNTNEPYFCAARHRPQIRDLEIATDPPEHEPAGPRHAHEDHRRQYVDQGRRAPAVHVPHHIAEIGRGREQVGGLGEWGTLGCGVEAEVAAFGVNVPALVAGLVAANEGSVKKETNLIVFGCEESRGVLEDELLEFVEGSVGCADWGHVGGCIFSRRRVEGE